MAWAGRDAISVARNLIGPTNGREAAPGTIRGDYGMDIGYNMIHGSDAPETAAVSRDFRVFVQTSSDGLLIGDDPNQILGTSHVHLPNGQVENLEDDLKTLHQGLYYVDYLPALEGIYVFHMVTFDEGNISHGSGATNVMAQDISGISAQILELNQILDETKTELANLKQETSTFGSSLSDASSNLDESVVLISNSVGNIEEGSSQLNALLFPVVASIAIILAAGSGGFVFVFCASLSKYCF